MFSAPGACAAGQAVAVVRLQTPPVPVRGVAGVQGRFGVELRSRIAAHPDRGRAGLCAVCVGQLHHQFLEKKVPVDRVGKLGAFVPGVPVIHQDGGPPGGRVGSGTDRVRAGKVAVVVDGVVGRCRQPQGGQYQQQAHPTQPGQQTAPFLPDPVDRRGSPPSAAPGSTGCRSAATVSAAPGSIASGSIGCRSAMTPSSSCGNVCAAGIIPAAQFACFRPRPRLSSPARGSAAASAGRRRTGPAPPTAAPAAATGGSCPPAAAGASACAGSPGQSQPAHGPGRGSAQ